MNHLSKYFTDIFIILPNKPKVWDVAYKNSDKKVEHVSLISKETSQ